MGPTFCPLVSPSVCQSVNPSVCLSVVISQYFRPSVRHQSVSPPVRQSVHRNLLSFSQLYGFQACFICFKYCQSYTTVHFIKPYRYPVYRYIGSRISVRFYEMGDAKRTKNICISVRNYVCLTIKIVCLFCCC